jgi:hypothetical protein
MAKLKPDPVQGGDLVEFLESYSDFSFEIQVLNALVANGFVCEHGGTYDDPVTRKPRQFDIRATRTFGKRFLRLAVECKNLRSNFPVLISCLPRRNDESFHEIAYSVDPATNPIERPHGPYPVAMLPQSRSVRLTGTESFYEPGKPVGKACDQVGRLLSNEITANDSDVYEKWSQALSSAHELTYLACTDGKERTGDVAMSFVVPVVVVPDGRLWVTHFDKDGNRIVDPHLVERCSYFVGRSYFHPSVSGGNELSLSHLEFVTVAGLGSLVHELCGTEQQVETTFPAERVFERLQRQLASGSAPTTEPTGD